MKVFLLVFLIGTFFWAAPVDAQQPNHSLMGLSIAPPQSYVEFCIRGDAFTTYTVFFYLNYAYVSSVNGFECRLWAEGDATILGWNFPVNAIDAGSNGNTVVGFAEPVWVIDGTVVLATVDILAGYSSATPLGLALEDKSPINNCPEPTATLHLGPTRPTSSIDGTMAFLDADATGDPLRPAFNALGREDDVIMFIQAVPVSNEQHTWGSIKATFR